VNDKPAIGFIGTGTMGKPMARNLLRGGYRVYVHNRTPERLSSLVSEGAYAPGPPAAVASQAGIVITMLPGVDQLESVLFGDDGIAQGLPAGALFIDMSTIHPQAAREAAHRLAERGIEALDAPVSGGEIGALEATLAIFAGGSRAAYDRAEPVLQCMGAPAYMGASGTGQIAKLCNQLIVVATVEAVAEGLALGKACGIDVERLRETMLGGFAASRVLDVHGKRMIARDFTPGGALKLHLKDWESIQWAMTQAGLDLPEARAVFERVTQAVARGLGDRDQSALYLLLNQPGNHR